ncbi:hypothetical protein VKT23_018530 [Stygiomarasmius scandens]|uniref:Uncharacterized protein n=1 Tax=Marasmiellus scandens TaxID=2682957 RepID=A0ABR1IPC4_9AGAR
MSSYKGKGTNRGWAQLPDELVRTIAQHYLLDLSLTKYCPNTWETRAFWQSRMLYTVLRDMGDMERFMSICPQWHHAVQYHPFWEHAVAAIDPRDTFSTYHHVQPNPPVDSSKHQPPSRPSPYRHFRYILSSSCLVCRINSPHNNNGLTQARHSFFNTWLGQCGLCREHNGGPDRPSAQHPHYQYREREHRERSTFCGLCLREAQPFELALEYGYSYPNPYQLGPAGINPLGTLSAADLDKTRRNPLFYAGCVENEDDITFPGVETTCRMCREEWLWRRITTAPELRRVRERDRDRERSSRVRFDSWEWDHEARNVVESFIEVGEGTVDDVVSTIRDRWWLRKKTKLGSMLEQAVAAERFLNSEGGGTLPPPVKKESRKSKSDADYSDTEDAMEEEEEEEEEEDPELLQLTEESGVRDLALSDWARRRILDGFWINPADQWYDNFRLPREDEEDALAHLRAVHPCPWSTEDDNESLVASAPSEPLSPESPTQPTPQTHPLPETIFSSIPPSFTLCEEAYRAYQKEIRSVLLPGMRNLVRRIVLECALAAQRSDSSVVMDPAVKASKMSLQDVARELRECEGIWWDGWDWSRFPNVNKTKDKHTRDSSGSASDEGSTPASTTSGASGTGTSPVLSTSTLGTTPSPPPHHNDKSSSITVVGSDDPVPAPAPLQIPIPISPVLDPPRLLRPIPYIPMNIGYLPSYSSEALKNVWREACAPLYHCRCRICLRATEKANAGAQGQGRQQQTQQVPEKKDQAQVQHVERVEVKSTGGDGEIQLVQIQLDEAAAGEHGDGQGEEVEYASDQYEYSEEEEEEYEYEYEGYEEQVGEETVVGAEEEEDVIRAAYKKSRERERYTRSRSPEVVPPPKWARDKERDSTPLPASPGRPRKRSCDEVDDAKRGGSEERRSPGTPPKRIRRESPLPLTRAAKGVASLLSTSPSRKRSSEELEDEVAGGDADATYVLEQRKDLVDGGGGSPERRFKRFKTHSEEEDGDVVSPPRSLTGESTGERWESVSSEERGAVGVRI